MLKYLLTRHLVLLLLWTFYIFSYMIVISDLSDILITWGFEASRILLKIWLFFNINLTILELMGMLVFSIKYGISMIFRYSTVYKSNVKAILFITIIMLCWSILTKSTLTLDLIFLSVLLMLVICVLEEAINLVLLSLPIETIICFLKELLCYGTFEH